MKVLLDCDIDVVMIVMWDYIVWCMDQINDVVSKGIFNIYMDQIDVFIGCILILEDVV